MSSRRLALLLGVALVVLVPVGRARPAQRPVQLRMEGYVGPPPAGRVEDAVLLLGVGDQTVRFQVTKARIISGPGFATDVFERVRPYKPNFIVRGPKPLLAQIAGAAPGTRLVITGLWRWGSRDFAVGAVEQAPAAPAP